MKPEPTYHLPNHELRGGKEKYKAHGNCSDCGKPFTKGMVKGLCKACYSRVMGKLKEKRKKSFPF